MALKDRMPPYEMTPLEPVDIELRQGTTDLGVKSSILISGGGLELLEVRAIADPGDDSEAAGELSTGLGCWHLPIGYVGPLYTGVGISDLFLIGVSANGSPSGAAYCSEFDELGDLSAVQGLQLHAGFASPAVPVIAIYPTANGQDALISILGGNYDS